MCRMVVFLMRTFDLNILQGLPENSWHDVCEPHHLHDDLQRQREQGVSVFQHLPWVQRTALQFRGIQELGNSRFTTACK